MLETAYDTAGRAFRFTSFDVATSGAIVNEVERSYNGWGQLVTEWQAHGGAVNTSRSTKIWTSGRTGQRLRAGGAAWPVDRPRRPIRRPSWRSRRVQQGSTALFYSADWQVLEERDGGGIARVSMVWSPVYIDAMIARDRDSDTNGSLEERLYVVHDANFNVSSIMSTGGSAVERFLLDPYGSPTFLDAAWSVIGSSAYAWSHLHQGGWQSAASSLCHFRHREFSPTLGRWMTNDPIGFFAQNTNLQGAVHNSPPTSATHGAFKVTLKTGWDTRSTCAGADCPMLLPLQWLLLHLRQWMRASHVRLGCVVGAFWRRATQNTVV